MILHTFVSKGVRVDAAYAYPESRSGVIGCRQADMSVGTEGVSECSVVVVRAMTWMEGLESG